MFDNWRPKRCEVQTCITDAIITNTYRMHPSSFWHRSIINRTMFTYAFATRSTVMFGQFSVKIFLTNVATLKRNNITNQLSPYATISDIEYNLYLSIQFPILGRNLIGNPRCDISRRFSASIVNSL